jgi:hypothetical protein
MTTILHGTTAMLVGELVKYELEELSKREGSKVGRIVSCILPAGAASMRRVSSNAKTEGLEGDLSWRHVAAGMQPGWVVEVAASQQWGDLVSKTEAWFRESACGVHAVLGVKYREGNVREWNQRPRIALWRSPDFDSYIGPDHVSRLPRQIDQCLWHDNMEPNDKDVEIYLWEFGAGKSVWDQLTEHQRHTLKIQISFKDLRNIVQIARLAQLSANGEITNTEDAMQQMGALMEACRWKH